MPDIKLKDNDIGVKILVWHRDDWNTPEESKEVICAVGVDAKQAHFALCMLELDPFEREALAQQLENCIADLKERKKIDHNCHIRCKNKLTGEYVNVYFRLAKWLIHAMRCRDDFRLSLVRGDIRQFLGGGSKSFIINHHRS